MSRKLLSIVLAISLLFLSSCTFKNPLDFSQRGVDSEDTSMKTRLGITVNTLNKEFEEFIRLVYTPSNQDDITRGLAILKGYMVDEVYERFSSRVSEYSPEYKQSIIKYTFNFAKSEDTHDHQEHIYLEFIWKHDGVTDLQGLEFVINEEGKIQRFIHLDGGRMV